MHALRAVELALPTLPPARADAVRRRATTLLDVRVALHRTTEKSSDRLVLQQQHAVADALGLPDADALMRQVSSAARTIGWTSDDKWRRVESYAEGPERAHREARPAR